MGIVVKKFGGSSVGTPEKIADQMEHWLMHEGADGFNLMPPSLPGGRSVAKMRRQ